MGCGAGPEDYSDLPGVKSPLETCPECHMPLTRGEAGGHKWDCSRHPYGLLRPGSRFVVVDVAEHEGAAMTGQATDADMLDLLRRLATQTFDGPRDSEALRGFAAGYAACQRAILLTIGEGKSDGCC